jgi:hypothetical protein
MRFQSIKNKTGTYDSNRNRLSRSVLQPENRLGARL